nr:putative glycoprotein [Serpentovirales sp.]WAK85878.1 putative glycoprotein [Serpentovirales sp.]WAK85892.1 ORF6 [Serpentovirales sp.]WAK85928.1 ORF6 [Serpentovirales sp.]
MSIARLFKKPSYHCHHNSIAAKMLSRLSLRKRKTDCKFLEYQDKSTQTSFEDLSPPNLRSITRFSFRQYRQKYLNPRPLGQPSLKHSRVASVKPYRERLI